MFKLAASAIVVCVLGALSPRRAQSVPSETLPPDPRLVTGHLANGLTYWLRHNNKPVGQVDLWLRVAAGARSDPPARNGVAHFAEHMGFNGSRHFPAGSLIPTFESFGLSFGKHQNATTSFDETVYYLSLPNASEPLLWQALLCLADFAYGATDDPAEVDKERGVVLAEIRDAEGSGLRLARQKLPFVFWKQDLQAHLGVGSADGVAQVRAKDIVRFRKAFYSPKSASLVIVGALDPAMLGPLIERAFSAWPQPALASPRPGSIPASAALRTAVFTDPDLTTSTLTWDVVDATLPLRTSADWRLWFTENLAERAFGVRMDRLRRDGQLPVQSVWAWMRNTGHPAHLSSLSMTMAPKAWAEAARVLFAQWWSVRTVGFTTGEVAGAKRALLMSLREEARAAKDNRTIAKELVWSLAQKASLVSETDILALGQTALPAISAKDIQAKFIHRFDQRGALWLQQPTDAPVVPPSELKALWSAAQRSPGTPLMAGRGSEEIEAALKANDPIIDITSVRRDEASGVRSYWLSNGTRLHVKRMTDEPGRVVARLTLAGAELLEGAHTRGRSAAAGSIFNERHSRVVTSSELRDFLLGRSLNLRQATSADSLGLSLEARDEDIASGFAVARLLLSHGALTARGLADVKLDFDQQRAYEDRQVEGTLERAIRETWACNDPRVAPPSESQLHALTLENVNAWYTTQVQQAPAEMAVVGDASEAELSLWGRRLLSALRPRSPIDTSWDQLRSPVCEKTTKTPPSQIIHIKTNDPRAAIEIAWPGPPYSDTANIEKLRLAAEILQAQLMREIRERLGLAYDVSCFVSAAHGLMGDRRIAVRMTVEPSQAEPALAAAKAIVEGFVAREPLPAELQNARNQLVRTTVENQQSSTFWANTLAALTFRGRLLDDITGEATRLRAYTKAQIAAAARTFLKPERRREIAVLPDKP